jgi:hypothetical protein
MTQFLKAFKQEENGESQSIVLHDLGAPDLTQSAAAELIVIDDDDDDGEEASQGSSSVEQAQTGRPFSGEASSERVHPPSRFFPNSNTHVTLLVGYLVKCYDVCVSDAENNKDIIYQGLIPIFVKSFEEVDALESNDAKPKPPPCRYPTTSAALIEYIIFNTTRGNTHVVLVGARTFLTYIRCIRNDLLSTLRGSDSAEKAACVIVAALLKEKMRNKPRSRVFDCNAAEELFDDNLAASPLEAATDEQVGGAGDEVFADADATAAGLSPGAFAFDDNLAAPSLEEATEQVLGGAGDEVLADANATAAVLPPGAFAFNDNSLVYWALPPLEEATVEQVLGGAGDEVLADANATAAVLPPGAPALLDDKSFEDEIRFMLEELSEQDVDNIQNGVLCLNEDPLDGETFANFNWGSEGDATHI